MGQFDCLLSPIQIGNLTFKNRITSAPISLSFYQGKGLLSEDSISFFERRAKGGAACVTIGESIPEIGSGKSHPEQIALDDPDVMSGLTEAADVIHLHDAIASIELSHGGGICSSKLLNGQEPIGPSNDVNIYGDIVHEMTEEDMFHLAEKYALAAQSVRDCGFDMLMIHGGHGWLLHQFLSPLTNHRQDQYGGSLENRARFPLMIVDAVRKAVGPQFPIEFRLSGAELVPNGFGLETSVPFAEMLDGKVDLIHVSAGNKADEFSNILMHPSNYQSHGANLRYAAEIKRHVKTPVATVGGFSVPEEMERVLERGDADIIAMARGLLADPDFPDKLAHGRRDEIISCVRCLECIGSMAKNRTLRCALNPEIGRESRASISPALLHKKKVLVIGGGPGGMQAAIESAERGHQVTLVEADNQLGGLLLQSSFLQFKSGLTHYLSTQELRLAKNGVKVLLHTKVTPEWANSFGADVIIAAIGSNPVIPSILGVNEANVLQTLEWGENQEIGDRVVIIGGGLVGCEIGICLNRRGKQVSIIEQHAELAMDCSQFHRIALLHELSGVVSSFCGVICTRIDQRGVYGEDTSGKVLFFPADTIILAVGMHPNFDQAEDFRECANEFYKIGDCKQVKNIMNAVWDAHCAVERLSETK